MEKIMRYLLAALLLITLSAFQMVHAASPTAPLYIDDPNALVEQAKQYSGKTVVLEGEVDRAIPAHCDDPIDRPAADAPNVLRGRYLESVYLGEVAQHMISLTQTESGGMAFKAFELNPLVGRDRAGEPAEVWVTPEQVIVTKD